MSGVVNGNTVGQPTGILGSNAVDPNTGTSVNRGGTVGPQGSTNPALNNPAYIGTNRPGTPGATTNGTYPMGNSNATNPNGTGNPGSTAPANGNRL
jgi:hypothetical protein